MPKTEKTVRNVIVDEDFVDHLEDLVRSIDDLTITVAKQIKPVAGKPKGAPVEIDLETRRQMAAKAQYFGLRNPDELVQIVLHAFLQLCEEDHWITFPLMLAQVPVGDQPAKE
jgi:hypothetical protein